MTKINEGDVQVMVATPVTTTTPYGVEKKVGHRCCGCCCDSRRAVIIVECIFGITFNVIAIALVVTAAGIGGSILDDDSINSDISTGATIVYGLGIVISLIVIYGAVSFKAPLVGMGIVWTVVQTIVGIVLQAQSYKEAGLNYPIFDAVIRVGVSGLLIYPLATFISEVRRGIMSKETYAREEHSCCCV